MVSHRRTSLLALGISALVALSVVVILQASVGAFVAPREVSSSSHAGRAIPLSELKRPVRQLHTPVESGAPGGPQKINLLFIGLLAGTAVIGLVALFAYGAYSGSGSGL